MFTAVALAFSVISCTEKTSDLTLKTTEFSENTDDIEYSMDVTLPVGKTSLDKSIREQLLTILEGDLSSIACFEEEERLFAPFDGDKKDVDSYLQYLSENTCHELEAKSRDTKEEAREYSDEYTPPSWGCDASLRFISQNDKYAVFSLFESVYYGGAHGGIIGDGHITFSKATSERITSVVDPAYLNEVQPLLRKGLNEYMAKYSDGEWDEDTLFDWLFVEDQTVPLPSIVPYPSAEGWNFTYREYEIGPYAMGMPEFTIPFDELKPYLTKQAESIMN